jgi:hypothetical protein
MSSTAVIIYLRWCNRQLSNNAYVRLFSPEERQ